jgi:hypothetical protein
VVGLRGEPRDLAAILADIAEIFTTNDVEVHKFYSPRQTNLYVRAAAKAGFDAFLARYPAVGVEELKSPTTFLAHAERMIVARRGFEKFMADNGITFREPHTPVVSNNDTGLLTTATGVRDAVLAITNEIMASRTTAETLEDLGPDVILELGLGDKSVHLLADNDVDIPTTSYTGLSGDTSPFLHAIHLVDSLLGQLCDAGDRLSGRNYRTLSDIAQLSKKDSFYRRYFYRSLADEMFTQDRAGSPAFHQLLEIYQHTCNYLDHVEVGELVLKARLKKRIAGRSDGIGQVYAELMVIDETGAIVERRQVHGEHAEVVVFHFDRPPDLGYADLVHNTHVLLDTQPLARQIYDEVFDSLDIPDDFLTADGEPSAGQLAVGHPVYQYALFQLLQLHRPATFMHDYYVQGSDPMGWLVALAVAGATTLPDVVRLYEVYLRDRLSVHHRGGHAHRPPGPDPARGTGPHGRLVPGPRPHRRRPLQPRLPGQLRPEHPGRDRRR